jgi:hypothetical protein
MKNVAKKYSSTAGISEMSAEDINDLVNVEQKIHSYRD